MAARLRRDEMMAIGGDIAKDTLFGPERPRARAVMQNACLRHDDWGQSDRGHSSGRAATVLQIRRRIHGRSRPEASIPETPLPRGRHPYRVRASPRTASMRHSALRLIHWINRLTLEFDEEQGGRPRSRDVVDEEGQRLVFRDEGACRRGCQQRCHAEGVPLARRAQPADHHGQDPRRPGVGRPPARRGNVGLGGVAIGAPLVRATMATAMSARRGRPRSRAPARSGG
jgi:hypothetical protein